MLSCREAARLVSEGLDHKLPWTRRLSLRTHLMMCGACSLFRRQVEGLDRLARRRFGEFDLTEVDAALSPEVRQRIKIVARETEG